MTRRSPYLIQMMANAGIMMTVVYIPLLARNMGASKPQIGLLVGTFQAAALVSNLLFGRWADFGDRILLNGAIDSQHVLIEGTPASVRKNTRDVLAIMKPGGGYVAGASHDTILEETPLENVLAMFDAIREFGGYGGRG